MLMSGLSLPEMNPLKVLRSGLLAIASDPVCRAIESIEPGPVGFCLRYSSQPGPCGSGTLVEVGTVEVGTGTGEVADGAGSTGSGVGSA